MTSNPAMNYKRVLAVFVACVGLVGLVSFGITISELHAKRTLRFKKNEAPAKALDGLWNSYAEYRRATNYKMTGEQRMAAKTTIITPRTTELRKAMDAQSKEQGRDTWDRLGIKRKSKEERERLRAEKKKKLAALGYFEKRGKGEADATKAKAKPKSSTPAIKAPRPSPSSSKNKRKTTRITPKTRGDSKPGEAIDGSDLEEVIDF